MERKINNDKLKKVREYMDSHSDYSLESFLNRYRLLDDHKVQGRNLLINCPYHDDDYPSMSVLLEAGKYQCFSCGANGKTFDFMITYLSFITSVKYSYYSLLEKFLNEDAIMKSILGFNSVYDNVESRVENLTTFKVKRFTCAELTNILEDESSLTPITLINKLKKDSRFNNLDYIYALSLLQQDFSASDVNHILFDSVGKSKVKPVNSKEVMLGQKPKRKVSLKDLLGGQRYV